MGCSHAPSPPYLLCSSPATLHLYPSVPAWTAHVASRTGNRSDKKVWFFFWVSFWRKQLSSQDSGYCAWLCEMRGGERRKGKEFRVGGLNHSFQGLPGFFGWWKHAANRRLTSPGKTWNPDLGFCHAAQNAALGRQLPEPGVQTLLTLPVSTSVTHKNLLQMYFSNLYTALRTGQSV